MKKRFKEDVFDEKKGKPKKKPGQWMDEEFFMKENSLHWEHDFRDDNNEDEEDDFFPKRDADEDLWDDLDK